MIEDGSITLHQLNYFVNLQNSDNNEPYSSSNYSSDSEYSNSPTDERLSDLSLPNTPPEVGGLNQFYSPQNSPRMDLGQSPISSSPPGIINPIPFNNNTVRDVETQTDTDYLQFVLENLF